MSTYTPYADRRPTPWAGIIAAIVLAQLLTLLAYTSPIELTLGLAIVAAISAVAIINPTARLFILIAMVPISSNFYALGLDFSWVREGDRVPLYSWFAVIAAAAIALEHIAGIRRHTFKTPVDGATALILFWALVTLSWAPNFPHALLRLYYLLTCLLSFYVATTLIRDETSLRKAVNGFIIVGLMVSIVSVAFLHFLDTIQTWSYPLTKNISFEYALKADGQRAKSITNPNATALFLNLSLALAIGSLVWSKGQNALRSRIFYFCACLILVIGVLETKSKGGIGSMVIMVLFLLITSSGLRSRIIANTATCLAILVGAFLVQTSMIDRTPRILDTTDVSLGDRLAIWQLGNDLNWAETRGWGLGVGGFTELGDPIPHAHSLYFSILFDLGPIGIILMLLLVAVIVAKAGRMYLGQQSRAQVMVIAGVGGSVAIAVHGLVDGSYRDPTVWMFLGIVVAAIAQANREVIERDAIS